MKLVLAVALIFCVHGAGFAQGNGKHPEFEVASVRQAAPEGPRPAGMTQSTGAGRISISSDRASYQGITLKRMLMSAYDLKPFQITGPSWIETERYDVVATIPEGAAKEEVPAMLQHLLAQRFRLTSHVEKREQPVYFLRVGKDGAKLKPTAATVAGDHPRAMAGFTTGPTGQATMFWNGQTMASFADVLSGRLDRAVIDQTGLTGKFDITLSVDAQELLGGSGSLSAGLFSAVQDVGLKLQPGKAPVDYLVVDTAQKMPTAN